MQVYGEAQFSQQTFLQQHLFQLYHLQQRTESVVTRYILRPENAPKMRLRSGIRVPYRASQTL